MYQLEQFINLGFVEKETEVLKHKVLFSILDGGQRVRVLDVTGSMDDVTRSFALQIETLARSIKSVDGKRIEYIPEKEDEVVTEEKKIEESRKTIIRWPQPVISLFFNKYTELVDEQSKVIDNLKNELASSGRGLSGKSEKKSGSQKSSE